MGLRKKRQEMAWRDDWVPPVTLRPTVALDDLQGRSVLCTPCRSHHFHNQSHLLLLIFVYKSAQISILLRGYSPVNSEDLLFETFIAFTKCTAYLIFFFVRYILLTEKYWFLDYITSYTLLSWVLESPLKDSYIHFHILKNQILTLMKRLTRKWNCLRDRKLLIEK